ncbi:hypothetical protein C7212DRAFT_329600 [Tuber magnatum]|uniref:Uncharacterized protein n=1 Tax=Tuber magnatum TaxID=42249 RepID=A0A317SKD5_9PEZI|nr:hypothetical protein C7212DRAFT_329600 [Tuber magnatum]
MPCSLHHPRTATNQPPPTSPSHPVKAQNSAPTFLPEVSPSPQVFFLSHFSPPPELQPGSF